MITHQLRIAAAAALLLLPLAACEGPRGTHAEPADVHALDGAWTVDFTLESPLLPGHMPAERSIHGELALLRNPSLQDGALAGRPTHSGSYATGFRPFGFDLASRAIPALEARLTRGDSVEIALQPGAPGGVRMRGLLAGDSVAGTWLYDRDRGGVASGRFVMRRRAGAAVP